MFKDGVSVESVSHDAFGQIERVTEVMIQQSVATGVAIAIGDRIGGIDVRSVGMADVEAGLPVTLGTAFEFGSIGKSFTACIWMQLAAEGLVDLHAPFTDYLPWFQVQSAFRPITVHDLLTHTAGIVGGTDQGIDGRYEVWCLRQTSTFAAAGQHFVYSNAGYKALGLALATILGRPYGDIVRERIFEPLGMSQSFEAVTSAIRPYLAAGYAPRYDDRPWQPEHGRVRATWLETDTGDGCLSATATELTCYAQMLLAAAQGESTPVLDAAQLATMLDPHDGESPVPGYGYGLERIDNPFDAHWFGHSGGMVGYTSHMIVDATNGLTAVVLANGSFDPGELARYALGTVVASRTGATLPTPPDPDERNRVDNAHDYTGTWESATGSIEIVAGNDGISLLADGGSFALCRHRLPDAFLVADPAWDLYPVEFVREFGSLAAPSAIQPVVKMHHGERTWTRPGAETTATEISPLLAACTGHYRSYNPWSSNFRVVMRDGRLTLLTAHGHACELVPDGTGYRYGHAGDPPTDWLEFDAIVDGKALMARSAEGEVFARFFTP